MIHDNLFLVDYEKLAIQEMPTQWRKPVHVAWIKLLIYPFKKQLERLRAERTRNIYQLSHDSRVGRVEKVLNDRFDPIERRIRIGDGNRIDSLYLYTEAEAKQTYLPNVLYTEQEIADRNTDFKVLIPSVINLPAQELEALKFLTKYYTGKDKQFKIELI